MCSESLLSETPGSELYATWEVLSQNGFRRRDLKKMRKHPKLVEEMQKIFGINRRRTDTTYPRGFRPLSIGQQIRTLKRIDAFADLDDAWVVHEAQDWYDQLDLPFWVEQPLVYVWHESIGGYGRAMNLVRSLISHKLGLIDHSKGFDFWKGKQSSLTQEVERLIKKDQPGDFIVVPSQLGDRWGGYPTEEVRDGYDATEFGHGLIAACCLTLSHPNRFVEWDQLDMDCPGDEFYSDRPGHTHQIYSPTVGQRNDKISVGMEWSKTAVGYQGSVTGFLPG